MDELKPYKNWVVAYLADKIPLNPNSGLRANVADPYTWSDYQTAEACVATNQFLTLGFVLTNTPFTCIDLDTHKTENPVIRDAHRQIYEQFNTYSELSPNRGVHIWCVGTVPEGKRSPQQHVEIYSTGRYMTVTRNALNGQHIESRQAELNELYFRLIEENRQQVPRAIDDLAPVESNDDICKRAAQALNGELFRELYEGKWQHLYSSQSEADQALVNIIAFYTDSRTQVAEIFHNSVLGQRKKSMRRDYLYSPKYGLITKAFDQKKPNVTYENIERVLKQNCDEEARRIISLPIMPALENTNGFRNKLKKLPEFIQEDYMHFDYEFPPGLIGEIAQFIFRNAVHPVREVAIGAALALLAGICGRAYNISNTGLNHYIAILAQTGGGKEGAASGIERLCSFIREKNPAIDEFLGPAEIASPQALIKHLSTVAPCMMSHKGEMGFWLQKLTSKYARSNEETLRGLLLDLYTKSGHTDVFRGSIYSDKARDIKPINAPAFTLLGDATPHTFYAAMDAEHIEEGFVGRFTIIECDEEHQSQYNEAHGTIVPDIRMVDILAALVRRSLALKQANEVVQISQTDEAYNAQMEFQRHCQKKLFDDRDSAEAKIYSRAHMRLLRTAGLIAVGVNPDAPVITPDIVEWTRKFVVHGIARVTWRFEHGEVGEASSYVGQQNAIRQIIRSYWENGFSEKLEKEGIDRQMFEARLITHKYVHHRIMAYAAFKNSRNLAFDLKNNLQELSEAGILAKIDMGKIRDSNRTGAAYYILDYHSLKRMG